MKKILLKQKIALLLAIVSVASLLVTSFFVYFYISRVLIENKKEEIFLTTVEQTHETILMLEKNQLAAHMLATRTGVIDLLTKPDKTNKQGLLNSLSEYTSENKNYLSIYVLDISGKALVSTDDRFTNQDYSFRDYFKKAIKGNSYIDVVLGKTSNQLGFYFSEPVYDKDDKILGVLVLKVDQSDVDNSVLKSVLSKDNIVMLVDNFGIILSSNDINRQYKSLGVLSDEYKKIVQENKKFLDIEITPIQYDDVYKNILNYKEPTVIEIYDKEDGDKELISLVKLDNMPFFMVVESRLGYIDSQIFNTVIFVIFIIALILIIISFSIFYFIKLFLNPIDKFIRHFNAISNGNFSQELKVDTKDEFADMADRVNKMAQDLSDLYKNLDEKVKEQTLKVQDKIKESEDQSRAILNILEDVEAEKNNAEKLADDLEKFKLAVDNVSDQIVITDKEGIVIYGNSAVENITGYTPEEALGKKAGTLWKVPMSKGYYENLWDIIKSKKKTYIGEIQNKRKNGEIYTAIISISSVLNKDGEIIYFVAIERDITKEKEIDKAKTEFVSLASHQLRTPLSAINWYTEMLLSGDAGEINEEQRRYLNEVSNGNKRMVDLVEDLLNVSRIDMGTLVGIIKDINIVDLLNSVVNEIEPDVLEKKISLKKDIRDNIKIFPADEKLLRMIYQNLLSNAVKYTSAGGEILASLFKVNKKEKIGGKILSDDSIVFSVSDTGMGIPKNQQDKIFLKLFRADNAKESETEGTGLGLYIIKSIAEQSDGEVWFESKENKGTTFYVAYPVSGMKMKEKLG